MLEQYYDVIIVGGRVAGSHAAARFGRLGFKTLLLERGRFPSLPAVSSPIIFSPTMKLLDEIGADESAYAHNTPKIYAMSTQGDAFDASIPLPEADGRNYAYAIDRARFDAALWNTAINTPHVTGIQNFAVTDLLRDGERVTGIVGKDSEGQRIEIQSDWVIGADGRFGIVGRKVEAKILNEENDHPTSIYYAYWHNVEPLPQGAASVAYQGTPAYGYLMMDSADNTTVVGIEGRADTLVPEGDTQAWYQQMLIRQPLIWQRLNQAEQITTVRGMKHIGNYYKEAGGEGWALIGDAYHAKDPLDGQGIYNAVITGKALAHTLAKFRAGDYSNWQEAIAAYDELARIKTYSMYKSLHQRIRASFYAPAMAGMIPDWAVSTMGRWMMDDPYLPELMGNMMTRQLPPDMVTLLTPPAMVGALLRGGIKDFRTRIQGK